MHQAQAILADPKLLKALQQLVHQAGEAIMQVYQTADFGIETKKDDSPVTKADLDAHYLLVDGLAKLTPHIAIVSEEDIRLRNRFAWIKYIQSAFQAIGCLFGDIDRSAVVYIVRVEAL